jgi:hypothetical protein
LIPTGLSGESKSTSDSKCETGTRIKGTDSADCKVAYIAADDKYEIDRKAGGGSRTTDAEAGAANPGEPRSAEPKPVEWPTPAEDLPRCIRECIEIRYGEPEFELAKDLSVLTPIGLAASLLSDASFKEVGRAARIAGQQNIYGDGKTGLRLGRSYEVGRRLFATSIQVLSIGTTTTILGAGATGFVIGAGGYCAVTCAISGSP